MAVRVLITVVSVPGATPLPGWKISSHQHHQSQGHLFPSQDRERGKCSSDPRRLLSVWDDEDVVLISEPVHRALIEIGEMLGTPLGRVGGAAPADWATHGEEPGSVVTLRWSAGVPMSAWRSLGTARMGGQPYRPISRGSWYPDDLVPGGTIVYSR
jgi:hypothetical protein